MVCVLEEKLQKCKECFQRSYGQNLERLTVVKVSINFINYNPRQKSMVHLDQMARKYADKVIREQYLLASLE